MVIPIPRLSAGDFSVTLCKCQYDERSWILHLMSLGVPWATPVVQGPYCLVGFPIAAATESNNIL